MLWPPYPHLPTFLSVSAPSRLPDQGSPRLGWGGGKPAQALGESGDVTGGAPCSKLSWWTPAVSLLITKASPLYSL